MRRRGQHGLLAQRRQQRLGVRSTCAALLERGRHDAANGNECLELVDLFRPLVGADQRLAGDVLRRGPEVIVVGLVQDIELETAGRRADDLAHLRRHGHGLAERVQAAEAELLAGLLGLHAGHEDAAALPLGWGLGQHAAVALPLLRQLEFPVAGQARRGPAPAYPWSPPGVGIFGRRGLALEASLRQRGNVHPQRCRREDAEGPQYRPPIHEFPSPIRFPAPLDQADKIASLVWLRERCRASPMRRQCPANARAQQSTMQTVEHGAPQIRCTTARPDMQRVDPRIFRGDSNQQAAAWHGSPARRTTPSAGNARR